ncbi:MAG: TolC family protein [Planctomycetaceae bacterium]|nr:TolC family protein [Planctomycetaceae bacterium]
MNFLQSVAASTIVAATWFPMTALGQSSSLKIQPLQPPSVAEPAPVLPPDLLPATALTQTTEAPEQVPPPQLTADDVGSTLEELTFLAQTANPALREASAKVGVAQGNAVQVGLAPNPTLYTSSPQWTGSISQYNVYVGQDFITAGKLKLNRAAAQRAVEQAQLDFTRTRFEVMTNVRRQFYLTAAAQRRVEVLGQLMQIAARSRDLGDKLQKAGETNKADATLLEIEWDKAEMAHLNSTATLIAAKKQLAAVIGIPEHDVGRLVFDLAAPLPEYEHEALRLGVVDRNALAGIAALDIRKTQIQLRRALVEPRPNFNIQAGYQYSVEKPLQDQGYGQFSMAVPLWNRNQGGIRAAQAETARATATLQRVENDLSQQAAAALGTHAAAVERVAVYEQRILPKARSVFDQSQKLFEQGQTDFLRLLQSQRTLVEADLGYLDAQEARWSSAAAIAGLLQVEQFP